MKFSRTHMAALVAAALGGGIVSGAAAQTAPATEPSAEPPKTQEAQKQDVQKLERVEVTGSRVKRTPGTEGTSPVQIIGREQIERSGATTAADVLRNLSAQSGASYDERNASLADGTASISLRGLAPNATLVLINGRRASYNGFSSVLGLTAETFFDLNTLPVDAIDRIEVLKDGASALYGSDAIAGVVNVILRQDFRGAAASVYYGDAKGGADESGLALSGGFGNRNRDGYNAFVTIETARRDYLFARDRDYAAAAFRARASDINTAGTLANFPANAIGLTTPIDNSVRCPGGPTIAASPATLNSTLCGYDAGTQSILIPQQERKQLFGRVIYDLSANISLFAEVGYSAIETRYQLPSVGLSTQLAANNPGNPFGQPVLAFYRFADLGPRQFGADNQSTRVLAGAKGQWNTHDWEFALGEAKTDSEQSAGNLVRQAPWTTLVDAGTFTLFQPNSAATLNAVRGSTTRVGETKTRVADARLSGNTPWRLAAPIGYAAGIEYRRESQRDAPLAEQSDGTLAGFGSTNDAFSAARNATAVFGELALPLLKNLDAQVAVRHERYSDFGSSTNPKLGLKYLPTPRLALRASGGTSFRAPSLIEANYPVSAGIDGLIQDTTRCRALGIAFSDCPATVVELALSSDPAIGPEKGRNYTPGAVFQPMAQFSAALDYVYIKYTDKIGLNYFSTFPPNGGPVDERFVTRGVPAPGDPAGVPAPITDVTLLYTNAFGQSIYKGYDFELEGRFDAAGGRIGIELSGTYLDSFRQTTDSSSAPQSQAGLLFYPRLRSTLSTSYTRGDWTGTLNINYVSRQRDTDNELEPEPGLVGEDITVDTQVQYSGIRNLKLSLGARNLFDRDPPRSESFSAGFNPTLSNPRGRFVYARLSYRFL